MRKANYRDVASRYDDARTLSEENMSMWLRLISERVGPGSARVLDLGCGNGRFAIPMATKLGYSVTGVDGSEEMIAKARTKEGADHVEWSIQNVTRLDYRASSFDVVFMSHLLHHLDEPYALIERCFHILKPGGGLMNRYGAMECISGDPEHTFFPNARALDEARTPTVAQIEAWFGRAGFYEVGSRTIVQQTDISAEERVKRVAARVSSVLTLLDDGEFQKGLANLRAYALAHPEDPWMTEDKLTITWRKKPSR